MADRPILRFPDPVAAARRTGAPRSPPRPRGPGRGRQGQRFQATFKGLAEALASDDPEVVLREDPGGIAPERALVFITAGSVQNFARAAQAVGLEVFAETELEEIAEFPEGFEPPGAADTLPRTLYATMPTLDSFGRILALWNAHQRGERAPIGAGPWWTVFDLLLELRPWGPEDRLTEGARAVIEDRLPFDESEEVPIELEIWPAASAEKRASWARETEQRIDALGGRVIDRSSIAEGGFTYEAVLAGLPVAAVRAMLHDPGDMNGLATLEGVQFILPQMIGQAAPGDAEGETADHEPQGDFAAGAPIRAALLDGVPAAAHAALDGGVVIEDIHDLVGLSEVDQRYHATAMASLILRGDLEADGTALQDTRLVSVPLLIDGVNGAWTPPNRLFVDLLHVALARLIADEEPLAADVFVVNFSIGMPDMRFAGRISALARLIDWWAARHGVLFIVSAGNISEGLIVLGINAAEFEDADADERRARVRSAMRGSAYERTLLAPAESLNAASIGAVSKDLNGQTPPDQAGIMMLEGDDETLPQMTSALGLGLHRAIKPDLLEVGGRLEVRALPNGSDARLRPVDNSQRTGLVAASPRGGAIATQKSRGTSSAAALTTRAILQSAEALTADDGPYEGQELPRRTFALLTRALAVNAARWPDDARDLYAEEIEHLGGHQHARAKAEVCRNFGYGVTASDLMRESPDAGVTMVGHGTIRKDQARIFRMPLPASMAGDRVPRSMRATLAWFSPVNPARAQYRLAGLEAVVADGLDDDEDKGWGLDLRSDGPDANLIKRGSVWSRRLVHRIQRVPDYDDGADIPICVQFRDTAGGGLSPDDDIAFAIAVTLEIEADVQYDILEEIEQEIRVRLRRGA
jgi:hypothetical protein